MEHMEKIPYIISVYFPVLLFLLAGLGYAWWLWYNLHAKRLDEALSENERLNNELAKLVSSSLSAKQKESVKEEKKADSTKDSKKSDKKSEPKEGKKESTKKSYVGFKVML